MKLLDVQEAEGGAKTDITIRLSAEEAERLMELFRSGDLKELRIEGLEIGNLEDLATQSSRASKQSHRQQVTSSTKPTNQDRKR